MGVEISPMTAKSAKDAAAIERVCFSDPWSEEAIISEVENPDALYLIARIDGETAGYIGMRRVQGEGHIMNVAVSPAYRRRGAAKALIAALIEIARNEELSLILLEVRAGNNPAIALYEGFGFERVGLRRGYYQNPAEDALLMDLILQCGK